MSSANPWQHAAICVALALVAATTMAAAPPQADGTTPPRRWPSPGPVATSDAEPPLDRWLVHFTTDPIDLSPLRQALQANATNSPATAHALLAQVEQRMRAAQAPAVAAIERLGGRIRAQWWIVNACAIELPRGSADQLRALPQILRLEPDIVDAPTGSREQSRFNHAVDTVHALGHSGAGAVIAIVDSGQDDVLGTSGRPHRTYFRGGNPRNTNGPGLAGSRLLYNKQMGAMPAGAFAQHGLAVTAVAAGGAWGTAVATHGNAFDADIAGYAIADFPSGNASRSTQTSTWQQVLVDRLSGVPIVVANLSYGGNPDPLGAEQQAMDQVSYLGDILIGSGAGNLGVGGTFGSQSNVNGLAIGAVFADSHEVLSYSTRGPMAGDPQRSFPDLAACIHSFVPLPDCETSDETFMGTSNASPQVAGIAAIVRAAVPVLTAVETKAVLLSAALDVTAANPGLDRNAFGAGLLRADLALATARDASLWTSATLTAASPTFTFPLQVTQGEPYAVAIAWHRKVMTSIAWSNLDLRILDGGQVVARSSTARNLYEVARFVADRSGTLHAEISGAFLEQGVQPFAIAVGHGIVQPARAGLFTGFGHGCGGSVGPRTTVCGGINTAASEEAVAPDELGGNYEVAFLLEAPRGTAITGVEQLLGAGQSTLARMSLHEVDAHKAKPIGPALATASVVMAPAVAWHRWTFPQPYVTPNGNSRPLAVVFSSTTAHFRPIVVGGVLGSITVRDSCAGAWSEPRPFPFALRLLCASGSTGVAPMLWNQGVPVVGRTFQIGVSRAVPGTTAVLNVGTSRTMRNGIPLPLDLTHAGAPGCLVLTSDDVLVVATVTSSFTFGAGSGVVAFVVANSAALIGQTMACQYQVLDPAANALGVAMSQGAWWCIGGG